MFVATATSFGGRHAPAPLREPPPLGTWVWVKIRLTIRLSVEFNASDATDWGLISRSAGDLSACWPR